MAKRRTRKTRPTGPSEEGRNDFIVLQAGVIDHKHYQVGQVVSLSLARADQINKHARILGWKRPG